MADTSVDKGALLSEPSDSDTAMVAFGARGQGRGPFPYARLRERLSPWSKIVVRDPAESWYQAGLPEHGDTLEEIAEKLRAEIDGMGAKRVVTFGPSMGGYAAILFGCLIGATRVIAFCPQTFLDPPLAYAPPPGVGLQAPDLEPIVRMNPEVKIDLIFGRDGLVDLVHARRIAHLPSVRILVGQGNDHLVVAEMNRAKRLAPLIIELAQGATPKGFAIDPGLGAEHEWRLEEALFAEQRGDWQVARDRVRPVAECFPLWAGPSFHLSRALIELGEWPAAECALKRVLRASPKWWSARTLLARALEEQGKTVDAERAIRAGLALDPNWLDGLVELGELLSRHGRKQDARAAAMAAERVAGRLLAMSQKNVDARRSLSRALLLQGRLEEGRAAEHRSAELSRQLGLEDSALSATA